VAITIAAGVPEIVGAVLLGGGGAAGGTNFGFTLILNAGNAILASPSVTVSTTSADSPTSCSCGVPEINPVVGSMDTHDGRPVALNTRSSLSESLADARKLYVSPAVVSVAGVPEMLGGLLEGVVVSCTTGSGAGCWTGATGDLLPPICSRSQPEIETIASKAASLRPRTRYFIYQLRLHSELIAPDGQPTDKRFKADDKAL
jgi:hypothetical protein